MNKEQQELLDEVYKKYQSQTMFHIDDLSSLAELDGMNMSTGKRKKVYRQYAQEEFIDKCKTDSEFSERWGLKIEERELSVIERIVIAENSTEIIPGFDSHFDTDEDVHKVLDTWNTPTKLITITYNDKTIESYE
jgi:hypothetical protein